MIPFDVVQSEGDMEDYSSPQQNYYNTTNAKNGVSLFDGRASLSSFASSTASDSAYEGMDQIEFFQNVIAYLYRRIQQDTRGPQAQQVDEKYD